MWQYIVKDLIRLEIAIITDKDGPKLMQVFACRYFHVNIILHCISLNHKTKDCRSIKTKHPETIYLYGIVIVMFRTVDRRQYISTLSRMSTKLYIRMCPVTLFELLVTIMLSASITFFRERLLNSINSFYVLHFVWANFYLHCISREQICNVCTMNNVHKMEHRIKFMEHTFWQWKEIDMNEIDKSTLTK